MKTPNTLESVQPLSGQYSFKKDLALNAWFLVAAALYLLELSLRSELGSMDRGWRIVIALLPLVPGALCIRSWVRFSRGLDEFQRRVQAECWLVASIATLFVGALLTVLSENGFAWTRRMFGFGLGIGGTFVFLFLFWAAAVAVVSRRYK